MFRKFNKNHLRIALFSLDFCLIILVLFIVKNVFGIIEIQDFKLPPKDIIPELTQIPTLPLAKVLGLQVSEIKLSHSSHPLLTLINSDRGKRGLPPLSLDPSLTVLAQSYSEKMANENFFSHTDPGGKNPFQRLSESGIGFQTAGENIAFAPTIGVAHSNLMNSEEHRKNILSSDYKKIGIGVHKASGAKLIITEVFTN